MIDKWLNKNLAKDWRYYFIKYPEMTSTNNNLYSMDDDDHFKIRELTGYTLRGWHINPYVRTVALQINDNSICDVNECYTYSGYESPVYGIVKVHKNPYRSIGSGTRRAILECKKKSAIKEPDFTEDKDLQQFKVTFYCGR